MLMKSAINYKLINIALFLIVIFLLGKTYTIWYKFILVIINVLKPFIISFSLTYFLYPVVRLLSKKINKNIACFIVLTVFILTFYLLFKITIPILYNESFTIIKEIKYFLIKLKYPIIEELSTKVITYIQDNLVLFLSKSINIFSSLITILILITCFLFNYEVIVKKVKSILIKNKPKLYFLLSSINKELLGYVKGIGIIMLVEIVEYTIIYKLIGHPNYLLLSSLTSLTTIIPFFGGLVSNIIAVITASTISKKLFILTSVIVIVMPIIDSYIIQPKIYKGTNQISPLSTIIVVILGGIIFKTIGIIIAIPLYIVIKNIIAHCRPKGDEWYSLLEVAQGIGPRKYSKKGFLYNLKTTLRGEKKHQYRKAVREYDKSMLTEYREIATAIATSDLPSGKSLPKEAFVQDTPTTSDTPKTK